MSTCILVIEDEAHLRSAIQKILCWQGYEVVTARNGTEGLTFLRSVHPPPSLIISDWLMPNMGGALLLQMLRADPEWQRLPLLFLSGADERLLEPYMTGAACYLKKPFVIEELLNMVQALL